MLDLEFGLVILIALGGFAMFGFCVVQIRRASRYEGPPDESAGVAADPYSSEALMASMPEEVRARQREIQSALASQREADIARGAELARRQESDVTGTPQGGS